MEEPFEIEVKLLHPNNPNNPKDSSFWIRIRGRLKIGVVFNGDMIDQLRDFVSGKKRDIVSIREKKNNIYLFMLDNGQIEIDQSPSIVITLTEKDSKTLMMELTGLLYDLNRRVN